MPPDFSKTMPQIDQETSSLKNLYPISFYPPTPSFDPEVSLNRLQLSYFLRTSYTLVLKFLGNGCKTIQKAAPLKD